MQKYASACFLGAVLLGLAACGGEEDPIPVLKCYPALVKEQGCGTVLEILDQSLAQVLDVKANGDTVLVNTFNLPSYYQVKGTRLYVTLRPVPKDQAPQCPDFTPIIYPQVKLITVQKTPCTAE